MKKIMPELLIALIIIVAVSLYQGRNLLSSATLAPALHGFSPDGSSVVQSDYSQPTLIYFFAPWCTVCKLSMGNLNWLGKLSDIEIIIVGLDYEKPGQVFDLVNEKGLTDFKVIAGDDNTSDQFKIQAYPTYYTIRKNGVVQSASVGYSSFLGMLLRSWLASFQT